MTAQAEPEFIALVELNGADLVKYIARRTVNRSDIGDLFHDVLLVAWRRWPHAPTEPGGARMWLFVIARNVLSNARRRHMRHAEVTFDRDAFAVDAPNTDEALDVRRAVLALAPRYRELVMLVHWDGFTVTEAATVLGIAPSTARTRHSRALGRLLRALSPDTAGSRRAPVVAVDPPRDVHPRDLSGDEERHDPRPVPR